MVGCVTAEHNAPNILLSVLGCLLTERLLLGQTLRYRQHSSTQPTDLDQSIAVGGVGQVCFILDYPDRDVVA